MFPDAAAEEDHVTALLRADTGDDFDSSLMLLLPFPQQVNRITTAILVLIDFLVACVARQHQITEIVQLLFRNSIISARANRAKRIDVCPLANIDGFLCHRAFPQLFVAPGELAATSCLPPKGHAHGFLDVPRDFHGTGLVR